MTKTAYLYVLDTMADWEPALLIAELNSGRFFRKNATGYTVRTLGITKEPVVTMGGVRIVPDMSLEECVAEDAGLLILPGGETWLEDIHAPILDKAKEFLDAEIPVAAICGATLGMARAGLLDHRYHTSNDPGYLKAVCPSYTGESFYREVPVVTDGRLVTATGIAPLEFTRDVLKVLDVCSDRTLEAWYRLYLTHESQHYYALVESLEE